MYFNDPSLYGATLPQREFTTPFVHSYGQWQNLPYTNVPWQGMSFPWQGAKSFVPPMFQQQIPPYFAQGYGFMPQFGAIPFAGFQGYGTPWYRSLPY